VSTEANFYDRVLWQSSVIGRRFEEMAFLLLIIAIPAALIVGLSYLSSTLVADILPYFSPSVDGSSPSTKSLSAIIGGGGCFFALVILVPVGVGHFFATFNHWQRNRSWSLLHRAQWSWAMERIAKRKDNLARMLKDERFLDLILVEGRPHFHVVNLVVALLCVETALILHPLTYHLFALDGFISIIITKGLLTLALASTLLVSRPDVLTWLITTIAIPYVWIDCGQASGTLGKPVGIFEITALLILLVGSKRVWRAWKDSRKARYLLVSDKGLKLVEHSRTLGLCTTKINDVNRLSCFEDHDGFHLTLPLKGGGSTSFVLQTDQELKLVGREGTENCKHLNKPAYKPALFRGGRLSFALLALVLAVTTAIGASYVYFGLSILSARVAFEQGSLAPLEAATTQAIARIPFSSAALGYHAHALIEKGRWTEALATIVTARNLSFGMGHAGSIIASLDESGTVRFVEKMEQLEADTELRELDRLEAMLDAYEQTTPNLPRHKTFANWLGKRLTSFLRGSTPNERSQKLQGSIERLRRSPSRETAEEG